jgi:hypothetical protein
LMRDKSDYDRQRCCNIWTLSKGTCRLCASWTASHSTNLRNLLKQRQPSTRIHNRVISRYPWAPTFLAQS